MCVVSIQMEDEEFALYTKDNRGGGDNSTTVELSRVKLQSNGQHQQTNTQLKYNARRAEQMRRV